MPGCAKVEARARQESLSDRVLGILDAPRSQILSQGRDGQPVAEFMLQSHVARAIEIFFHQWPVQEIPRRISRNQRCAAPGTSHGKFDVAEEIAGMQVLVDEWTSFVFRAACDGYPIEKGTRVQVEKLSKQVLAHEYGRNPVAPHGELQAAVEGDGIRAKVQNRVYPAVQDRVVGVAI